MYPKVRRNTVKSSVSVKSLKAFQASQMLLKNNAKLIQKSVTSPKRVIIKPMTAVEVTQTKVILESCSLLKICVSVGNPALR